MFKNVITALTFLFLSNIYAQKIDVVKWTEDLKVYKTNLEKLHIDLYHNISKTQFENELQKIQSDLDEKTELEIIIDLMRLTRKIGDGHTAFSLQGMKTHLFPIELYKINKQWRVIKTTQEHKDMLGKILIEIDNKPIDKIAKEVSKVAQYIENKQSKTIRTSRYLSTSEILFGLKLTNSINEANFTFIDDAKNETKKSLKTIIDKDYYSTTTFESFSTSTPEIQKPKDAKHNFLWFSPIQNTKAVYIKFESYPSFEDMEKFGLKVLTFINENASKQVVIDLRNNGGGDFFIGTFLAYYLNLADSINWKSGVYVLTDKVTFSAATTNATQFRQMLNAKIVGEPTGSNPTGYQDMGQFTLPNSGRTVTYSKRLFRFQEKVTAGVQPDVVIQYDWKSYINGIDNMLQWVIDDIKKQ